MIKVTTSYYLLLHLTVFLFGFTGILGRLISLPGDMLVWYRTCLAILTILAIILFRKISLKMPIKTMLKLIGIGIIVGAHWVTFFYAIKISNVSIALSCLSITTLFVSLIEPFFFHTKISRIDVIGGICILIGMLLITHVQLNYWQGIITGLISAMLAGIFTILNRRVANQHNGFVISGYEMVGANMAVGLFILLANPEHFFLSVSTPDWLYLIILSTLCTAFAYWAIVFVLKHLSAYSVVMSINLEPIYGTVMAAFIFNEYNELHPGFYIGSILILISVFVYSRYKIKSQTAHN